MGKIFICSEQYFKGKVKEVAMTTAAIPFGDSLCSEQIRYFEDKGDFYLSLKGIEPEDGYTMISEEYLIGVLGDKI